MNRSPQEKFTLLFETAKRSLLAATLLSDRISHDLAALEPQINRGDNIESGAISPLLSAVAFIDFAHRFGSVVDALPLINKKAPELRLLRAALRTTETARNHLQHMRGDLSSNAEIDYPILGSISWANGISSYTLFLSQPTKTDTHSLVYDTHENRWVAQRQYTVKGAAIDIDATLREMNAAYKWIVSISQFPSPDIAKLEWGGSLALGFQVQLSATQT